jgi:signal transduction histidine kinase/ActR/RegA family two-component response regulator
MWDAATDFTTGSDEMLRIFGLDPRTQTLPSFDRQRGLCYPVDDWERIEAAGRRAMKEGIDYEMDAQALRGGTPFWVCIRGEDVRDSEGRLIGLRGTVQDITARKQAEEALRLLNDQLEQKVQTRTAELAARAAQLRALASELAHTEQRERRRMAGIIHDHLQQLLVAAKFRVTVLGRAGDALVSQGAQEIETLLDNSLAEARSLTAELSPPILHEGGLLAGLDWLARWMADKHGLFVEQSVETTIPPLADDLKVLLFESTRELLFNAVKYSKARHAAVSVRALDGRLQLVVSDQGIGFDPRALKQAGSPGGGFGLFSIRERLSLVGGALEIDSAPGRGSRMVLSVPFVEPAGAKAVYAAAPPMASTGEAPPVTHPGAGLKVRVMLADDHLVLRQGLASLLAAEPDIAIVGEAADGQQAVSLACSLKPDVILMDMSMPRLNGVEATRIIHNDHPGIRIIGLSMFEDTERAQAMREAGAVSYLTKSGPVGDLIAAIRASMAGAPGVAGAPAPGRPAEES